MKVSEDGRVLAQAGKCEFLELPIMTQKFYHLNEAISEMEKIADIWNKFSAEEVNRVKMRWATDLLANQQYITEKGKAKPEFKLQLADAMQIVEAAKIERKVEFKVA